MYTACEDLLTRIPNNGNEMHPFELDARVAIRGHTNRVRIRSDRMSPLIHRDFSQGGLPRHPKKICEIILDCCGGDCNLGPLASRGRYICLAPRTRTTVAMPAHAITVAVRPRSTGEPPAVAVINRSALLRGRNLTARTSVAILA